MIAIVITVIVCVGSLGLLLFLDNEVRGRGGDE